MLFVSFKNIKYFVCFVLFLTLFVSGTNAKSKRIIKHDNLSDKFYNNGRGFPAVVRDKYYTYYNVSALGSNAVKDLTINKINCDFVVNDCIRKVCKNKDDLLRNSSYVYCYSHSIDEISKDIQNCLIDKDILEKGKYNEMCQSDIVRILYKYYDELEVMESEFAKVSASCILAKDNLYAAEQCYFYLMDYDDVFDDNVQMTLRNLCGVTIRGGSENMSNQFFSAGMYGLSDIYRGSNKPIAPFSDQYKKRTNWKEIVQAIYDRYRKNMLSSCGSSIE